MSMSRQKCQQPAENMIVFPGFPPSFNHAVFNRHYGTSPPPFHSNNVSFGLGDLSKNVYANREQLKKALCLNRLVSARQAHGPRVYLVKEIPESDLETDGFDALITNVPGVGLMIQQADCQAVMLFDPGKMAVGIAHVGWRGSVADIISKTVSAMNNAFVTKAADLVAAISPSLGPCCAEFVNYRTELPFSFHDYQVRPNYFDFWTISHDQLCSAGLRPDNIHLANICTCCNRDYFSYRRDRETGRFASVIGLK